MTPPALALDVHHDLTKVDPEVWDKLQVPGGFYASMPWLRHAHATADPPPWYVTVSRGDLLAAMPAYPLSSRSPYVFCRTDEVVDSIHRDRFGHPTGWAADLMPTLSCGGRSPSHTRIGVHGGLDVTQRRCVVDAVLAATDRQARAAGLRSVAFLYVDEDDLVLRTALRTAGYLEFVSDRAYVLDLAAGDAFAAYLAGFRHGRRHAILRELRLLAAAGVTFETRPLTDELIERIAPLELALYARHGTRADPAAFVSVLRSIARHTGDLAQVITATLGDRLAGFLLVFAYAGEIYARQTGFDYAIIDRLPVYFGLVYTELVRAAGRRGLRRIYYSTGSGAVKRSRGCREIVQFAYVNSNDPATRSRLAALAADDRSDDPCTHPRG